jgi:hypothetical protein
MDKFTRYEKTVGELSRKELIEALFWTGGGNGFGICRVANMMMQSMMRPETPDEDWPFNVTVQGKPKDYTDDELRELLEFSREMTADYNRMFKWRMGCNLIIVEKNMDNPHRAWWRKRQTWTMGYMWSSTLEDALDTFRDSPKSEWKRLCLAALAAGDEDRAFEIYYQKRQTDNPKLSVVTVDSEFYEGTYGDGYSCRTVEEMRERLKSGVWKVGVETLIK